MEERVFAVTLRFHKIITVLYNNPNQSSERLNCHICSNHNLKCNVKQSPSTGLCKKKRFKVKGNDKKHESNK